MKLDDGGARGDLGSRLKISFLKLVNDEKKSREGFNLFRKSSSWGNIPIGRHLHAVNCKYRYCFSTALLKED